MTRWVSRRLAVRWARRLFWTLYWTGNGGLLNGVGPRDAKPARRGRR